MSQQKKQIKKVAMRTKNKSCVGENNKLGLNDQQWFIGKAQFNKILQQFVEKQEYLLTKMSQLEHANKMLSEVLEKNEFLTNQFERYKHLLEIKEKIIDSQQKQYLALTRKYQELNQRLEQKNNHQQKNAFRKVSLDTIPSEQYLDELSRISDSQNIENFFDGINTTKNQNKRKICLKKKQKSKISQDSRLKDQTDNIKDLQIAKLKNQISKLNHYISSITWNLSMMQIELEHQKIENSILNQRQRRLTAIMLENLISYDSNQDQGKYQMNQKCSKLQGYINRSAKMVENQPQKHNNLSAQCKQYTPPPITPHFSLTTFTFPIPKSHQNINSNCYDQIFEAFSSSEKDGLEI